MNDWQRPFDREKMVRETRNRAHVVFGLWPSLVQKAHAGLQPARETAMTFKNATRALVTLAKGNPEFRKALRGEMARGANININIRDFAIDEFSQHQMLRNLQEGDLIEILFEPNELHPRRVVTRLVASDFEPTIPGVLLRGAGEAEEILADRGEGMPLVWEPGAGEPAAPVIELKIVHSKLASEGGDDKATAAQVQFAMDLSKEKGKGYTKSDLAKKTKAQISTLIEAMQGEANVASDKQVAYALSLLNGAGRKSPSKSSLEKMPEADVSKLIDELKSKKATDFSGGEAILQELGGYEKLATMIGARDIKLSDDCLTFKWPNRVASKGTRCMVAKKGDKYSLGFGAKNASGKWEIVGMYHVAKEELVSTFEKHTGWFLRL